MKCTIPEISWHNRDPVLSVDIQPKFNDSEDFHRLATGGTDSHVLIWYIKVQDNGAAVAEFAADLTRHQRAVNVVRFSPSGEFLASGDDESAIIIWKQKTDSDCPELPGNEVDGAKEHWVSTKVLRGHVDDVYDLSWSADSKNLISGSVDNLAILWDVQKGSKTALLQDHKGFVQGVAWDPKNQLVSTMCSDRKCRVFNIHSKKVVSRMSRSLLPVPENSSLNGVLLHLYHDDTFKSFFRRLCFSPDGNLLITPSGLIEDQASDISCNATYIYTRKNLSRPCAYLPSNTEYTIAVRCCPVLYELREMPSDQTPMFDLPYRMVMAVAEQKSVVLYDTQQNKPFAVISNIHYTRLTDLTWSSDGLLLIVSSTDGYCSIVTFDKDELGIVYNKMDQDPKHSLITPCKNPKQQVSTPKSGKKENGQARTSPSASKTSQSNEELNASNESKTPVLQTEAESLPDISTKVTEIASCSKTLGNSSENVQRIEPISLSSSPNSVISEEKPSTVEVTTTQVEGKFNMLTCKNNHQPSGASQDVECTRKISCVISNVNDQEEKVIRHSTNVESGSSTSGASVEAMDVSFCTTDSATSPTSSPKITHSKIIKNSLLPEAMEISQEPPLSSDSRKQESCSNSRMCNEMDRLPLKEGMESPITANKGGGSLTLLQEETLLVSPPRVGKMGERTPSTPQVLPSNSPAQEKTISVSEKANKEEEALSETANEESLNKASGNITPKSVTPNQKPRTPRRVNFITISSPKVRKNLLG